MSTDRVHAPTEPNVGIMMIKKKEISARLQDHTSSFGRSLAPRPSFRFISGSRK